MNKLFKYNYICLLNILVLFSLFLPLFNVRAESTAGYITTDAVRFRSLPTTKNSDILDTLNTNTIITILDENKIYDNDNNDCNDGWLKVAYDNKEGYICSKYITTNKPTVTYDRPWNTPYKAIVGGAKFISAGYISKGQYTSYLKKFNVNPNGYYSVYNHEYQTNIMAPFSEAYNSWKAYDDNKSMDLPFIFTIPVFNNMADSYLHPAGKKANLSTTDETDDAFEEMIKDFPDSYKPYLRDLHKEHKSWVFNVLNTGLDFNEAVNVEKNNGSIYYTQSNLTKELDGSGNPIGSGEKNWYLPNAAATAYYMDPRNFLNETYVFMFENLSFSDSIGESVVQSVLSKNSLLSGYDLIDNMNYSTIFMKAGQEANVNPVYLASLSNQEVGSNSGLINGVEFEYKGITYSGLFNFYNIGASSSAENPVKAGLVYASGGVCTKCGEYDPSVAVSENTTSNNDNQGIDKGAIVSSLGASLNGNYIKGFNVGEAISTLQGKSGNVSYSEADIIKTGMTLTLSDGTTYTAVVYGDVSGDGKINSADLLKIRQHLLGTASLSGAYLEAAKVAGNDNVNSANLLKIRQYLLASTNISQG